MVKKKTSGCLMAVLILLLLAAAGILAFIAIEHSPKEIDSRSNGEYTVTLQAVGSPEWPFGSQDGRIVLRKNKKKICTADFVLHNDGKNMGEENWTVDWAEDCVKVTINGEEQSDKSYYLYYDGKTSLLDYSAI